MKKKTNKPTGWMKDLHVGDVVRLPDNKGNTHEAEWVVTEIYQDERGKWLFAARGKKSNEKTGQVFFLKEKTRRKKCRKTSSRR